VAPVEVHHRDVQFAVDRREDDRRRILHHRIVPGARQIDILFGLPRHYADPRDAHQMALHSRRDFLRHGIRCGDVNPDTLPGDCPPPISSVDHLPEAPPCENRLRQNHPGEDHRNLKSGHRLAASAGGVAPAALRHRRSTDDLQTRPGPVT